MGNRVRDRIVLFFCFMVQVNAAWSAVVGFSHAAALAPQTVQQGLPQQSEDEPSESLQETVAQEGDSTEFDRLCAQEIDDLQVSLTQLAEQEMTSLQAYINSTQKMPPSSTADVVQKLQVIVQGFLAAVKSAEEAAVENYLSTVKSFNPEDIDGEVTQQDHEFMQAAAALSDAATAQIENMVTEFSATLVQAAAKSSPVATVPPVVAKHAVKQPAQPTSSWWSGIKSEFSRTASEFMPVFKQAVAKEANKQVGVLVSEVGGTAVTQIAKSVGVTDVVGQIKGIGQILHSGDDGEHSATAQAVKKAICALHPVVQPTQPERVNPSMNLSAAEQQFLANRLQRTQAVLSSKFDIQEPLGIAFCCSGGGNRAMIVTAAILQAAARNNILQATLYCAGLSGSTWTIAPWVYLYLMGNLNKDYAKSLDQIMANFSHTLTDTTMIEPKKGSGIYYPPLLTEQQSTTFSTQLMIRYGYSQHLSVVDIWGAMISKFALKLVGSRDLLAKWSDLYALAQSGVVPMPLCAAAFDGTGALEIKNMPHLDKIGSIYEWLEMNMFDTGSASLGFCKTQYFGSRFDDGMLVAAEPEYPLSYCLGLYGAVFGVTLNDVIDKVVKKPSITVMGTKIDLPVGAWVAQAINDNAKDDITGHRFGKISAQFHNPALGMSFSKLKNRETVGFFDAGLAFNFPLPLCVERPRGISVIILIDSNPGDVDSLKAADAYFARKKISMPKIGNMTREQLMENDMTVFNDPRSANYNVTQPTILYFPTDVDVTKPPYITPNFRYTPQDVAHLSTIAASRFERQVPTMSTIFKLVATKQMQAYTAATT